MRGDVVTRKAFITALLAPLVALKVIAKPKRTMSLLEQQYRSGRMLPMKGFDFYEAQRPEPEILSSWTDPVTGDTVVLAFFPGDKQPDDRSKVAVTEFRIPKQSL